MSARHLYVHVPFCARRCTYCDFAIAVRRRIPAREFVDALGREASHHAIEGPPRTLYLGGGTPSRLGAEAVAALARLCGVTTLTEEFTLEANPDDVTAASARAFAAAGVNRLSIGAQSFDPHVLAWMHRTHAPEAIGVALRHARAAGIRNLSLDLIFALPGSLGRDWRRDLDAALALEPDHVSLYGLTVETGTALGKQVARGEVLAADDARYEAEYLLAHERLGGAGYRFYEVSNAARPGREAVHNRVYWTLAPYLGLGPSAHSFDGVTRWWNEPAYALWLALLVERGSAVAGREVLAEAQRRLEYVYLSLRTAEGLELDGIGPPLLERAERWVREGWAVIRAGTDARLRVTLTPLGWLRLDELVASV